MSNYSDKARDAIALINQTAEFVNISDLLSIAETFGNLIQLIDGGDITDITELKNIRTSLSKSEVIVAQGGVRVTEACNAIYNILIDMSTILKTLIDEKIKGGNSDVSTATTSEERDESANDSGGGARDDIPDITNNKEE